VRLVELVAHADGTLSIYTTIVDPLAPEGSMAARGLHLAAIDWQTGWRDDEGDGEVDDRNAELVQVSPPGFEATGPTRVRSWELP
jgi:hypothetical protein